MNINKCLDIARKSAESAKDGILKINGTLYTFEFCQREWVYRVYADGFLYVSFNTKTLASAKRMLKDWLKN